MANPVNSETASRTDEGDRGAKVRKVYRSPRLETFGSVGKMTGTSNGNGADLGTNTSMNKSCL